MSPRRERSVSGRALVVAGLALVALLLLATAVFGPMLQRQVRQETRPRTLREPIADGRVAGETWEAVARFDGNANCVELRLGSAVVDRACGAVAGGAVQDTQVTTLEGDATVAYGVAAEDVAAVRLQLAGGGRLSAPVKAAELGFPVGFWAVELGSGARLDSITALDGRGEPVETVRYSGGHG